MLVWGTLALRIVLVWGPAPLLTSVRARLRVGCHAQITVNIQALNYAGMMQVIT